MRVQHSNRCQQRPHISRPHRCSSSKSQRQLVAGNRRCAASESTSMVARSAATWDCRPGYCRRAGRRAGGQACAGTRQEVLTLDRGRWHQRLHQKRQHRQWRRPPPFTHSLAHSFVHSLTCTLTATSVPSCSRALCTWASDAAAVASGANSANSCSAGAPSSCCSTQLASEKGRGGTLS